MDGEHGSDRGGAVVAVGERFHAAEHEEAAAAAGDEFLEEVHLVGGEEFRLQVVDDDGVVDEAGFGVAGEAVAEFLAVVADVEGLEDGFVVALFLAVEAAEAAEERVRGLAVAPAPGELRLALGDADEGGHLDLGIVGEGAVEELVFPVRASADIKDTIGAAAAVDGDKALVVGEGGLGFFGIGGLLRAEREAVEAEAGGGRAMEEADAVAEVVGGGDETLAGHGFDAVLVEEPEHEGLVLVAARADGDLEGDGRVLEDGLGHGQILDGQVAVGGVVADDDGIDGREVREVGRGIGEAGFVPVGEDDDGGERASLVAFGDRIEGSVEGGGLAVEGNGGEVGGAGEGGIEAVAADGEVLRDLLQPRIAVFLGLGEGVAEILGAGAGGTVVADVEAAAVVDEDGDEVGPGLGALADPLGLEKAEGEEDEAGELEAERPPPDGRRELVPGAAVAEGEHDGGESDQPGGGQKPASVGENEGCEELGGHGRGSGGGAVLAKGFVIAPHEVAEGSGNGIAVDGNERVLRLPLRQVLVDLFL